MDPSYIVKLRGTDGYGGGIFARVGLDFLMCDL